MTAGGGGNNPSVPRTKDYYEVLGVERRATAKEISAAFRKLARRYHPDTNSGDKEAERRFKEISEAHDVLRDAEKRKLYDAYGKDWQAARQAGAQPGQAGPGPGGFGNGARQRTVSPEEFAEMFGGGGGEPFSDIFGSIFSGRGRRGQAASPPPMEAETTVRISLPEAYAGTSRTVALPDGRRLEVRVPAGVAEGTVLRVPGLLARVEFETGGTFEREGAGRDVRVGVTVPLRTALLGGEVLVPTLKGGQVKLDVKPETQNGTRLRLRGLGLPDPRGGPAGDLFAEVRVRLPLPLDEAGRRLAEQLPE